MKDFQLHLPTDVVAWLSEHPEINVSKLVERLVSDKHGHQLLPAHKPRGPVFNVRFTDATWAALIRTGMPPSNVIRVLIGKYIRGRPE